jgi:hypothetical protein
MRSQRDCSFSPEPEGGWCTESQEAFDEQTDLEDVSSIVYSAIDGCDLEMTTDSSDASWFGRSLSMFK